jgi:hypothetical protein
MKNLIFLTFLSFFTVTAFAQSANLFDGTWVGQGYQLNNNETWSIVLTIKGENMYIDYPSLSCNAKLTKIKVDKNKLFLSEKMINANTCIDNGIIELEWLNPNELRYKWAFSNGTPGSISTLYKF